jgi:hypothetical protein
LDAGGRVPQLVENILTSHDAQDDGEKHGGLVETLNIIWVRTGVKVRKAEELYDDENAQYQQVTVFVLTAQDEELFGETFYVKHVGAF